VQDPTAKRVRRSWSGAEAKTGWARELRLWQAATRTVLP
jgi:hypothetical protein